MVKLGKLLRQLQPGSNRQSVRRTHIVQTLDPVEETIRLQTHLNQGNLTTILPLSVSLHDCRFFEVLDGLQERGWIALPTSSVAEQQAAFEQAFGLQLVEIPEPLLADSDVDQINQIYVYRIEEIESGGQRLLSLFGPWADRIGICLCAGLDFGRGRVDITLAYPAI